MIIRGMVSIRVPAQIAEIIKDKYPRVGPTLGDVPSEL